MKTTSKTIFDPRYKALVAELVIIRQKRNLSQRDLAALLKTSRNFVGRTEIRDRRLDIIETIDLLKALGLPKAEILKLIEKLV